MEDLVSRGLTSVFSGGATSVPANGSCPWEPSLREVAAKPFFGTTSFYKFNTYLSGACALFCFFTISLLQFLHGTHFSRPAEQTKIIRIAHLVPAYSLISWFCVFFPQAYYYLYPWLDFVQAICMGTFFLLLLEFISPHDDQRSVFFAAIDIRDKKKDAKSDSGRHYDTPEKKLAWYRRRWILIFQYPVVALLVSIFTNITIPAGKYCDDSFSPHFAHLWLFIVDNLSVAIAVMAILGMYKVIKIHLKHHKPLAKLLAFKILVGLGFLQNILFSVLRSTNVMKPTDTLTYADIKVGIPTLVTCLEMVPIALFFHYAYSYRPYCLDAKHQPIPVAESAVAPQTPVWSYQGGFLGYRAYLLALNPLEVWSAIFFAFKMQLEHDQYQAKTSEGYYDSREPLRGDTGYQTGPAYGQVDPHHQYPQQSY